MRTEKGGTPVTRMMSTPVFTREHAGGIRGAGDVFKATKPMTFSGTLGVDTHMKERVSTLPALYTRGHTAQLAHKTAQKNRIREIPGLAHYTPDFSIGMDTNRRSSEKINTMPKISTGKEKPEQTPKKERKITGLVPLQTPKAEISDRQIISPFLPGEWLSVTPKEISHPHTLSVEKAEQPISLPQRVLIRKALRKNRDEKTYVVSEPIPRIRSSKEEIKPRETTTPQAMLEKKATIKSARKPMLEINPLNQTLHMREAHILETKNDAKDPEKIFVGFVYSFMKYTKVQLYKTMTDGQIPETAAQVGTIQLGQMPQGIKADLAQALRVQQKLVETEVPEITANTLVFHELHTIMVKKHIDILKYEVKRTDDEEKKLGTFLFEEDPVANMIRYTDALQATGEAFNNHTGTGPVAGEEIVSRMLDDDADATKSELLLTARQKTMMPIPKDGSYQDVKKAILDNQFLTKEQVRSFLKKAIYRFPAVRLNTRLTTRLVESPDILRVLRNVIKNLFVSQAV